MNRNKAGFTFVELVIVSLIIGILLAVALPKYASYMTSQSLLGLHNAIVAKLREAPVLTKALRKPVWGVIDLDNEKAWIEVEGKLYGTIVPSIVSSTAEISGIANNATPGSPITTGLVYYRFDYWGTCTADTCTSTPGTDAPSYSIHVGLKSKKAAYSVGTGISADFRSITVLNSTGRASAYPVGCDGTSIVFGSPKWPMCSEL